MVKDCEPFVNIDCADMLRHAARAGTDTMLYAALVDYPSEVLPLVDDMLVELARSKLGVELPGQVILVRAAGLHAPSPPPLLGARVPALISAMLAASLSAAPSCLLQPKTHTLQTRPPKPPSKTPKTHPPKQAKPYNLSVTKNIRDLDPLDIDKLVSVSGMVTRTSSIIPDMRVALFQCDVCGNEAQEICTRGAVVEPQACRRCESKFTMKLMHNRCQFMNKQARAHARAGCQGPLGCGRCWEGACWAGRRGAEGARRRSSSFSDAPASSLPAPVPAFPSSTSLDPP